MRIRILSDLHLEFSAFSPPEVEADVVVLAGDIDVGTKGVRWAASTFPETPVLYVLGNHEYYGKAFPKLVGKLREEAVGTTVSVLEKDLVVIGGVAFLGCTLWTDFTLFGDPRIAGYHATQMMTDYRRIRVNPEYRRLRSLDTAIENRRAVEWLRRSLSKLPKSPKVVISHHAPSVRSIPETHRTDLLSAAYASDLEHLVAESDADAWIHGHVHVPVDYEIGTTRVLCNPRGYPDELVDGFQPNLVIDVAA